LGGSCVERGSRREPRVRLDALPEPPALALKQALRSIEAPRRRVGRGFLAAAARAAAAALEAERKAKRSAAKAALLDEELAALDPTAREG